MCLQCSQYHCSLSRFRETQSEQQTGQFRELSCMALPAAAEEEAGDGSSVGREGGRGCAALGNGKHLEHQ